MSFFSYRPLAVCRSVAGALSFSVTMMFAFVTLAVAVARADDQFDVGAAPIVQKPHVATHTTKAHTGKKQKPIARLKKKYSSVTVKTIDPASTKLSAFEVGKYQYCGRDRDCIKANNGCCDCANGGEDVAVNQERSQAFLERFHCIDVNCGKKEAEPACGSGVVTCVDHKCRYVSPK